jgi:DNA invertase Pin-like site-specific DNA recombinase
MNGLDKIQPEHRNKRAFVYARQSTPAQVLQHRTSTERQLALTDLAGQLGWSTPQIELVAEDLGRSGKFADNRDGFQRLVAEVSLARVGAVFSLDASRLARSSADWHRLLEIAALTRTLLVDEQTIYDPRDPNDRLVLGMKGTMADFELVWLRQRMEGGRWHLVRKGEFRRRPTIGYVYEDDESSRLALDPDEEIHRAVQLLFERYRAGGSSSDVVRHFARHGVRFPSRFGKRVVWNVLTLSRVHQVLSNPLYSGAYVYGRTRGETALEDGIRRRHIRAVPIDDWPVVIRDAHPAYISWEEYLVNRKRMADNSPRKRDGTGPCAAREGRALLQGLLICGKCGSRLSVRYSGQDGRYPSYQCTRLHSEAIGKYCQIFYTRNVDEPLVELVLASVTREALESATDVVEIIEQQDAALEQQWKLRLEKARYEAKRAERQYDACEPENRVVARSLETRWNDKLIELAKLESEYEDMRRARRLELSDIERRRILELAENLPRLWRANTTTDRDRKLLLRMLIKEIGVRPVDVPRPVLIVKVLWHTNAVTELEVDRPGRGSGGRKINARVVRTVSATQLPDQVPQKGA